MLKDPHWITIISYIMSILWLVVSALYILWIIKYFHKSRRPATLDLPVGAVRKRDETEGFSGLGETTD